MTWITIHHTIILRQQEVFLRDPANTERDRRDMEAGRVPESLRSDEVHLNRYGYRVMGELVFRKLFPAAEC